MSAPSDIADRIKSAVTMTEVAQFYGFHPDFKGFICCPFHGEKTPSLKIYSGEKTGWHCFGCQRGGSVIDFVMELHGLRFPDACKRINSDFGLGITENEDPREAKARRDAMLRERRRREERKQREAEIYRAVAAEHRYWWEAKKLFRPDPGDGGFIHPMYAEAVKRLPILEDWLDENLGGERCPDGTIKKKIS